MILQLPYVHSLSFINLKLLNVLSPEFVFKSIRVLNIETNSEQINVILPQVECLQIIIDDKVSMFSLIDKLKYLSIVKFTHYDSSLPKKLAKEWFQEHSVRLKGNDHFTYRYWSYSIFFELYNQSRCRMKE